MNKVLLLKFGELFLKGKNKRDFLNLLKHNINKKLKDFEYNLFETKVSLVVCDFDESCVDVMIEI